MQTLYIETFERDPVLSLDMSYQLGETQKEKERLIAWMESRCINRQSMLPGAISADGTSRVMGCS